MFLTPYRFELEFRSPKKTIPKGLNYQQLKQFLKDRKTNNEIDYISSKMQKSCKIKKANNSIDDMDDLCSKMKKSCKVRKSKKSNC